jgi:hypothetical protein
VDIRAWAGAALAPVFRFGEVGPPVAPDPKVSTEAVDAGDFGDLARVFAESGVKLNQRGRKITLSARSWADVPDWVRDMTGLIDAVGSRSFLLEVK